MHEFVLWRILKFQYSTSLHFLAVWHSGSARCVKYMSERFDNLMEWNLQLELYENVRNCCGCSRKSVYVSINDFPCTRTSDTCGLSWAFRMNATFHFRFVKESVQASATKEAKQKKDTLSMYNHNKSYIFASVEGWKSNGIGFDWLYFSPILMCEFSEQWYSDQLNISIYRSRSRGDNYWGLSADTRRCS